MDKESAPHASPDGASGFRRLRRHRASDEAAGAIQSAIASGRYQFGERLPSEHELARGFGTSRGTIREALRILEATGFVEIRTGAGAFVAESPFSADALHERFRWLVGHSEAILEMLEVREHLQAIAAGGCATHAGVEGCEALRRWLQEGEAAGHDRDVDAFAAADAGFHFAIGEGCGNRMLADLVRYVEEIYRVSNRVLVDLGNRLEISQREHEVVVDHIVAGDADGAQSAMQAHIRSVRTAMAELLSQPGEP